MTSLNFQSFGTILVLRDRLKIRFKGLIKKGFMVLLNFGWIPSGPEALLLFSCLIALTISLSSRPPSPLRSATGTERSALLNCSVPRFSLVCLRLEMLQKVWRSTVCGQSCNIPLSLVKTEQYCCRSSSAFSEPRVTRRSRSFSIRLATVWEIYFSSWYSYRNASA